jgi:predicted transcriptional regulator
MNSIRENLMFLGVPRATAIVVEILFDGKPRTLREIERVGDLRQPEVSLAVSLLPSYLKVEGRHPKMISMSRGAYLGYIDAWVGAIQARYEVAIAITNELKQY